MKSEELFDQNKPVFLDTKGRRKHYLSSLSILAATVVTVLLTFFVISVLINPFLPQIKLKPVAALPLQLYEDAVYATEPTQLARAWSTALVLIVIVAIISVSVRLATGRINHES